jgi:hypothetical protein
VDELELSGLDRQRFNDVGQLHIARHGVQHAGEQCRTRRSEQIWRVGKSLGQLAKRRGKNERSRTISL